MTGRALLVMPNCAFRRRLAAALLERRVEAIVAEDPDPAAEVDVVVIRCAAEEDIAQRIAACPPAGVIALAQSPSVFDVVDVLRAGADDFVAQPVSVAELVARVRALIRRLCEYNHEGAARAQFGELAIDYHRRCVSVHGNEVELTATEFELLREIVARRGRLVRREDLVRRVWGADGEDAGRSLDTHIGRLRAKIEDDPAQPRHIITVPRAGYRIAA